ncbi:MAG: TolC family protein [Rhodothermales bacterium]
MTVSTPHPPPLPTLLCGLLALFALAGAFSPRPGLAGPEFSVLPDTVDLARLRAAAAAQDPRALQPEILARATRLRLESLRTGRLPQLALTGQATLQSDVPTVPITLPDGTTPSSPREQARAQVEVDWSLYDGGRIARQARVERARLGEQQAGVAVALYGLQEAVTEAYFGALLLQAQAQMLALAAEDVEARLAFLRKRAQGGAALASEAGTVEAEQIRIHQQIDQAEADRRAALAVLSDLTDLRLSSDDVLALPDLDDAALGAVPMDVPGEAGPLGVAERPEFRRFAQTQERAQAEARLATAAKRPTLSVFGQAGVGRPSPLDFLSEDVSEYGLVGVRVRWAPLDWGRARREAEAARLQADVAQTEADAFARQLRRETEDDLATLARLEAVATDDARVVALREEALRVARRQLEEGVLPAPDYTDALTDLTEARLVLERHRIERAQAQARLLSTLGRYPDAPLATDVR